MTLGWLQIIALLGAIQGVFLAGVLATKRSNRSANRLLAALMLCFSVFLATAVYHAAGFVSVYPHFFGFGYPLPFLFGPLVYLYAETASDRTRHLTRRDALHFLPFIAVVISGIPIYLMSGAEKIAFYQELLRGDVSLRMRIIDVLKLVSGVSYGIATLLFLGRHRKRVEESYSSTERVNLRWLLWLGGAATAIWLLAVAFQLLEAGDIMRIDGSDDYISLAIALLVYTIGYMGLRQPEVFRFETAEYPVPAQAMKPALEIQPATPVEAPAEAESDAAPRYERSGLTDRQAQRLQESLLALMDRERPWKDSELTLADLSTRLSTTPHRLSEVLNARLGQTFYDFVNGYRVREVERRIAAGEAERVTMLSLALDAGFASKSTFNAVFKKHTSRTPSNYRQAAGT